MIEEELKLRARRFLGGVHRTEDLDRFYLDLRERTFNRASFREIGDFVAHRDKRTKGPVAQVARDVITSVTIWSLGLRGKKPTHSQLAQAARANFRLVSDKQLKAGCGLKRSAVKKLLDDALPRVERGAAINDHEVQTILYLANRFVWKPAFTDDEVVEEFFDVLRLNRLVRKTDRSALLASRGFISLYALIRMHGTSITLDDGTVAPLFAGYANDQGRLEVKVHIEFNDAPKPIYSPVCMFLTSLSPEECCDESLLAKTDDYLARTWRMPLEIGDDGKLRQMTA
ncbi:hypothetical protein [Rhodopseudomonas palustris]|uniref:hypothetical protein n=1 Tax=Rhodopseudomonas palustris TaxID=1076 RepID=UPI0021F28BF3|nr:hypothetical protein [Rhodopseudomonas palustris]UYO52908.1 hypothetical protein KQX61_20265 [Rhodopseudomonas palustris]